MPNRRATRTRTLWFLLAATLACYGIGYPVALWGHSTAGWVLVFLGGPLLLTLGVLTVRHLHADSAAPEVSSRSSRLRP